MLFDSKTGGVSRSMVLLPCRLIMHFGLYICLVFDLRISGRYLVFNLFFTGFGLILMLILDILIDILMLILII